MMSVMEAARGLTFTLGPVEQIPLGEGRVFEVDGRSIAVFRTRQGEVFATQAACPHKADRCATASSGAGRLCARCMRISSI